MSQVCLWGDGPSPQGLNLVHHPVPQPHLAPGAWNLEPRKSRDGGRFPASPSTCLLEDLGLSDEQRQEKLIG